MRNLTDGEYYELLNKQLEKHGVTVQEIGYEEGWYSKYTYTTKEFEAWEKWAIKFLMKKCNVSKKYAERAFVWINLQHGLKIED
jgi:hypothetical protein